MPSDPAAGLEEHRPTEGTDMLHTTESYRAAVIEVEPRHYGATAAWAIYMIFG